MGQLLVAHDLHHRQPGGAGDWVAAIRATEAPGTGRVHDVRFADDGGERKAGGEALGHGHQVGLHA